MYASSVECFCPCPHSPMVASIWNFLVQVQDLKRILVWVKNEEALHIAGVSELEKHLQILAAPCNTIKYKYILFPSVFGYDKLWTTVLRTKLLPVDEERLFELIVIRSDVTSIGFGVGPRSANCRLTFRVPSESCKNSFGCLFVSIRVKGSLAGFSVHTYIVDTSMISDPILK